MEIEIEIKTEKEIEIEIEMGGEGIDGGGGQHGPVAAGTTRGKPFSQKLPRPDPGKQKWIRIEPLALALLATATFAFLGHRRRQLRYLSDPHPSFRAACESPSISAAASNNASVNGRTAAAPVEDGRSEDTLDGCGKLYSPGLRPLPPPPRHFQHWDGEAEETGTSEEEFLSPRGSLIEKESYGRASSSWRTISAAAAEECGSRSSSRSTPPYPSSNLDASPRSWPVTSSPRVRSSSGHYGSKCR
ncbi:formin-like protein 2 [Zingiber officinale]|uniref:formin-like protein 2 n=1 Tax=Zingiber officinale TaxID=94328 RepID=UPI001C4C800B|nr:formin-like protein 2 [Zingiber officinale]